MNEKNLRRLLAATLAMVVLAGVGFAIYTRFREIQIPDEREAGWRQYQEERITRPDVEGTLIHRRDFKDWSGTEFLSTYEVFGKVVHKKWAKAGGASFMALQNDNGTWRAAQAADLQVEDVFDQGKLAGPRFTLRNADGCLVARRLVGRFQN